MFRNPPGYCTTLEDFATSGSVTLNGCPGRGELGRESAASPPLNANALRLLPGEGVSVLSAALQGFSCRGRLRTLAAATVGAGFGMMSHRADTGQLNFGEGGVPLDR